jgi:REP element-mobilizing transposase RayT
VGDTRPARTCPRVYPVSAKGAFSSIAWGNAPGTGPTQKTSAESAIQSVPFPCHYRAMPQSLSKLVLHLVFSTKNREPWLDSAGRPRMHAYPATLCRDLGGEALCVNGVADHVHIVTTLSRTLSQAELIEGLKKPSSKWIKSLEARYRGFSGSVVRRFFGQPEPAWSCAPIRAATRGASSYLHFSGRISRVAAQARY